MAVTCSLIRSDATLANSRVKRSEISVSSLRSMRPERLMIVTLVPRAEKTWANSAAMNPAPRMMRRSGCSDTRITWSEVTMRSAHRESSMPGTCGTRGRDPAARTI